MTNQTITICRIKYNDRNVDYKINLASLNIVLRRISIIIRRYLNDRKIAAVLVVTEKKFIKF